MPVLCLVLHAPVELDISLNPLVSECLCMFYIFSVDDGVDLFADELGDEFIADVVDFACSVAREDRNMVVMRIVKMSAA
jgi:hypothetical protein